MSVLAGGRKVVSAAEREEWSSKKIRKKYSGITGEWGADASQRASAEKLEV
jgi:hypothetical protein